jgi:hypothetical protein
VGPDLGQLLKPAQRLLERAIEREGEAHRLLLAGDHERARPALADAAALYRRSWEEAPPRSFGRLVGMLKAAVLAGDARDAAAYVRDAVPDPDSSASWYAAGLAALVLGEDDAALRAAAQMRAGSDAFARTADAVEALARRDAAGYARAVEQIVADFERREEHLTGVPIADTALMLERLAARRGIAAELRSRLLPVSSGDPPGTDGGVEPGSNG